MSIDAKLYRQWMAVEVSTEPPPPEEVDRLFDRIKQEANRCGKAWPFVVSPGEWRAMQRAAEILKREGKKTTESA